jgi:hypothetical protein
MTSSFILPSNPNFTSNFSWYLPFISFPIHITPQIRSWQHHVTPDKIHIVPQIGRESFQSHLFQSKVHLELRQDSIFKHLFSPHSTSNLSWELPVTSFPIHIALQIRSWQHSFTSVPIHIAPHIRSWQHYFWTVAMHILSQIGRKNFLSHPFQSADHLEFGHDSIL